MPNDSSTGGYLLPASSPAPADDAALDAVFQTLVTQVTGMPGSVIRPRWQAIPPQEPTPNENWCAIGVISIEPDFSPNITHSSSSDTLKRHERIELLASFYGPNGQSNATIARDGIAIPQNMEALNLLGFGLIDIGTVRSVPELINQKWRRRYDLSMSFRRQVIRVYPVLDLASAELVITSDTPEYSETVEVDQ